MFFVLFYINESSYVRPTTRTAYISAAQRIEWDFAGGHIFPVVTTEGGRDFRSLSAARMSVSLKVHLREASLPGHFTMHSFRVGGSLARSLAGTAVDEIMKIGGWKTETIANYYIGATSSGRVEGGKRKRGQRYADASRLPLSPEFEKDLAAWVKVRVEASVKTCLGETTTYPTRGLFKIKHNKILSNDATKFGQDHGSTQEVSSKN